MKNQVGIKYFNQFFCVFINSLNFFTVARNSKRFLPLQAFFVDLIFSAREELLSVGCGDKLLICWCPFEILACLVNTRGEFFIAANVSKVGSEPLNLTVNMFHIA